MKCKCGNDKFYAHQVCHLDIVVDEDNNFLNNHPEEGTTCVYQANTPFGPYTCTECGQEYPDLSKRRENLMKVQKDIVENF